MGKTKDSFQQEIKSVFALQSMCGIIAAIARDAGKFAVKGLKLLEYRGYDSCGIAWLEDGKVKVRKAFKIEELKAPNAKIAIAHTRWATHGMPNLINAHPHLDCEQKVAVVHNGIISNYPELKRELEAKGHVFKSETDTEVIAHLIEENLKSFPPEKAFLNAVERLQGSYAIACLISGFDGILLARKESPLLFTVKNAEAFAASDPLPLIAKNKKLFAMDENSAVLLKAGGFEVLKGRVTSFLADWDAEQAAKQGFEHFMLKEIFEQPRVIFETISDPKLSRFGEVLEEIDFITAAGTSYHAGLAARYAGVKAEVILASEFPSLYYGGAVLGISQSGETADTIKALKLASKEERFALVNVVGSTIYRMVNEAFVTHAGPEIGVAATKTFVAQLAALYSALGYELGKIPELAKEVLKVNVKPALKLLGKDVFFIGRGPSYVTALEGALKLKEISYLHAEGYAAGELKHGPLALIEPGVAVVVIAPCDRWLKKTISNAEEVKARGASIIGVGCEEIKELSDVFIAVPQVEEEEISPILHVIPLQLLAYYKAVELGRNPDKPRNLAKSVTVE